MRILWLSPTPGLLHEGEGTGGYGGSGWVGALQHLLMENSPHQHQLGIVYPDYSQADQQTLRADVSYYPVPVRQKGRLEKLRHYYGGYHSYDRLQYVAEVQRIICSFHPDVIHLFGLENPFATLLGHTDVPILVHLQGLLGPCSSTFFPSGVSRHSFWWPPTVREWLWRNGYQFAKRELDALAQRETELCQCCQHYMGRTTFDYQFSRLQSPTSSYHRVNEALRPSFYAHAGQWQPHADQFVITSTISDTVYKGLDLILKTAQLLRHTTRLDFEWQVVGLNEDAGLVRFFERSLSIQSSDVGVRYMDVMTAEQLVEHSLRASVYVHPSYIDNSPNSVCEAQILGLPVIATRVGGVDSLIEHNVSGLLVPANAPYELAYWITQLASNPSLSASLSQQGCATANLRHDRASIIHDLLSAYVYTLESK